MKKSFKEALKEISKDWKEIPNSVKFWNSTVLLILISIGIYDLEVLGVVSIITSLLAFAIIIENADTEKHLWIWFTPLMWILTAISLIVLGGVFVYSKTIDKFNDWLDSKGEDSNSNFDENF